jgi:hypothetical protein
MADDRSIHLREVGEEWVAVEEDSEPVGRGSTAQQALADLQSELGATTDTAPIESTEQSNPIAEVYAGNTLPTVSPKFELLFAIAAMGFGGMYLLVGNVSGAILFVIGFALLVRVLWIEYDLFHPKK